MNPASSVPKPATPRSPLALFQPSPAEANVAFWRINGYRVAVIVWTAEEWERLSVRPTDAQYYPSGVWCALRLE